MSIAIEANHPALAEYHARLSDLARQNATHEQATRIAFTTLLDTFSRSAHWTLVLEERLNTGKILDGTLKDEYGLPRGWWEAKDIHDDLDKEIAHKKQIKYPLRNTIFENTQRAVLYQNEREAARFDLTKASEVAQLLTRFFNHTDEEIEEFHLAVDEFQARIPTLATALKDIIARAHQENPKFHNAFLGFHEMCRGSLNKTISQAAIEEMLVQHLLTERLFRTVFENPEFLNRNIIAREIESVINALTSQSFSRSNFLAQLDSFYKPIEKYGADITDWSEKQSFLNALYERFFQGYSVDTADTMGIVYTPQPIVDWMCESVQQVLADEFATSLSTREVKILDPCTGTGNFIVNLLRRIDGSALKYKYQHDLFANEIMLLPYYIASMNIEHEFWEQAGEYRGFDGLCFADTLDLQETNLFSEANTERIAREKAAKLTVIIGNPPYNVGQKNENDNNKNRTYEQLDKSIRTTYAKASNATLNNKLYDPYVRFFKWASERLDKSENGVICFVTNNSFVDRHAFDGMRKYLQSDFDLIYHLDLHGDVRKNPKLSGTTHNVFGIQVGVGITILVRNPQRSEKTIKYFRVPEDWKRVEKEAFLAQAASVNGIEWQTLTPNAKNAWLTEGLQDDFESFLPIGTKEGKRSNGFDTETIFHSYSLGVGTNRDAHATDFNHSTLIERAKVFIDVYNDALESAKQRSRLDDLSDIINTTDTRIQWTHRVKLALKGRKSSRFDPTHIRAHLYRPFTKKVLYFDDFWNERRYLQYRFFPSATIENQVITLTGAASEKDFCCLVTDSIANLSGIGFGSATQCFPFYTYDEDGTNRTENITDWALQQFRSKYLPTLTKRDIFHYVYALLHHPTYRAKYAENLKRELPRLPLLGDAHSFGTLSRIGAQLSQLHLNYESAPETALRWVESKPFSWRVEKMKLSPDKRELQVNSSLTLADIPPETFDYRLGNRSALEWIVDQYQVKTDKRSGLSSDPNRADDEEYIARLIGRVVTVSVETVKLVNELEAVKL